MILAVDPGKDKTGCAVVEEDGSLVVKKVVPTVSYEKEIGLLLSRFPSVYFSSSTKYLYSCSKTKRQIISKRSTARKNAF